MLHLTAPARTPRMQIIVTTIRMAFFAGALGCSSIGPDGPDAGSFRATVAIPDQAAVELSGVASSSGDTREGTFFAQLVTPEGNGFTVLYVGASRPAVGEHRIASFVEADGEPPSGEFLVTGTATPGSGGVLGLMSVSGTVVVSVSTPTRVEGTFEYLAARQEFSVPISISGTFDSVHQEQ